MVSIFIFIMAIAALFGAYEKRLKTGEYVFRIRLFVGSLCIIMLFLGAAFFLPFMAGALIDKGGAAAAASVMANRARLMHVQQGVAAVFPEITAQDRTCITAGLSSYIEDMWKEHYRAISCAYDKDVCADDEATFYRLWRKKYNPHHLYVRDFDGIKVSVDLVEETGKQLYATLRNINRLSSQLPEPRFSETDHAVFAKYEKYFAECDSLQPAFWADPAIHIDMRPAGYCLGECLK